LIKISTALVFGAAYSVVGLWYLGWRNRRYWLMGAFIGLLILAVGAIGLNTKPDPNAAAWAGGLAASVSKTGMSYLGYYAMLYWPWLMAVVLTLILARGRVLAMEAAQRQWAVLGAAGAIMVLGELPNWLIRHPGSGFFARVMVSVQPALLAAVVVCHIDGIKVLAKRLWRPDGLVAVQRTVLGLGLSVLLLAALSVLLNSGKDAVRQLLAVRRPYVKDEVVREEVRVVLGDPSAWGLQHLIKVSDANALKSSAGLSMVRTLMKEGRKTVSERRLECVYVPREVEEFWKLLPPATVPYVLPALTQRCMIYGLPDPASNAAFYGLGVYPRRMEPVNVQWTPEQLEAARKERCPESVERVMTMDEKGRLTPLPKP
jgi:hypothetical protein